MSNNSINTRAIDSLKNILITSSQYNFEKEYIDENNVEQYVHAYYSDLESNENSRLKLKDFVNKLSQTLNIDLNNHLITVEFATIDSIYDNSSLDGLIESVNKKIEFIEDMSYQANANKEAKAEAEADGKSIENNINVENEGKPFDLVKTTITRTKDAASSIKNFLSKQTERISSFFMNKEKIKEVGNKLLEKMGIAENELDASDKSTLAIEHLLKIRELREAGVEINDNIASKIKDPNFDKDAIIKEFLDNPEIDKINPEPDKTKSENIEINTNDEVVKNDVVNNKESEIEYEYFKSESGISLKAPVKDGVRIGPTTMVSPAEWREYEESLNKSENDNAFDINSVDNFKVSVGSSIMQYYKDKDGKMYRYFIIGDKTTDPKEIKDFATWESSMKKSIEYQKVFEVEAEQIENNTLRFEEQEQERELG